MAKQSWLKKTAVLFLVFLTYFLLIGCGGDTESNESQAGDISGEDFLANLGDRADLTITISTSTGEVQLTVGEIAELPAVTRKAVRKTESVEEEYLAVGPLLEDVLGKAGVGLEGQMVRFLALDGYSVQVPPEILENREIIIAYAVNGELLDERSAPLRVFIPNTEAMYWVSQLETIELQSGGDEFVTSSLWFLETAVSMLEVQPYEYLESDAEAIPTADLLEQFAPQAAGEIYIVAADGLEKNEKLDIFLEHFLVTAGVGQPLFTGPDLPRGMQIREILWLSCSSHTFFSLEQGLNTMALSIRGENEGLPLEELLDRLNMVSAGSYNLEASDGYQVELESADLDKGVVYFDNGEVAVSFNDLPRFMNVKGLLKIEPVD